MGLHPKLSQDSFNQCCDFNTNSQGKDSPCTVSSAGVSSVFSDFNVHLF